MSVRLCPWSDFWTLGLNMVKLLSPSFKASVEPQHQQGLSGVYVEQLYKTRQHFVCSAKTDTTTPGKLGRAVGFRTRASRAGVGF